MKAKWFSMRLHGPYFVTLCCNLYTLYPALATVTWYGDFSTNTVGTPPNLRQYPTLQCGGTGGTSGTCPFLNDGVSSTHGPQPTSGTQAPLTGCPAGSSTCRLYFVPSATMPPPPGVTTPVLQVRLGPNDFTNGGKRNELVGVTEAGGKSEYQPGDDRYFAWYTHFPSDFPPPESTPSWRLFGQFHQDGNCGSPPQEIALVKDTPTTYRRQLTARTVYNDPNSERVLWTAPPGFGFWHYYVLHVYFDPQNVCTNGSPCNWDSPNGGAIEFWVDGFWQGSWAMITLYNWPPQQACPDDPPHPPGPMNSYLKQGLYRDQFVTSDADRVFHCCMKAATTCLDVLNSNSCARTPTGFR